MDNHNHSNMDDSLCLVMIIEIWMTFMLRITVIEIWVILSHSHSNMGDLVTVIEIWVTCTCLTMNAHIATMESEDYKAMDC